MRNPCAETRKQAMAIYHLKVKVGSKDKGQSAKVKHDYLSREGKYARGREELEFAQSGNMPEWVETAKDYWEKADTYERANGRLFCEIEFALPRELNKEQRKELVLEFARDLTTQENLPYTLAIHRGKGENPHAHLMISERKNDGVARKPEQWFKRHNPKSPAKGGAKKSEAFLPPEWVGEVRERWATMANGALERAGREERIDHRSLEAQGIGREPGKHLGPAAIGYERRTGEKSRRRENYEDEINARLAEAARLGEEEREKERAQRRGPRLELDGTERWRDELARYEREAAREKAVEEKLAAKEREEEEAEEKRKQEQRNRFVYAEVEAEEKPRHYIDVGPWDADIVQQAGAQYDYRAGRWYVPENSVDVILARPGAIVEHWREEVERQKRAVEAEHQKLNGRALSLEKTRYEALAERWREYTKEGKSRESMDRLKGRILDTKKKIAALELTPDELQQKAEEWAKKANPKLWLEAKIIKEEQKKKAKEEAEKRRKEAEARKRTPPSKPKGRGFW